jgi:hypothetical protein
MNVLRDLLMAGLGAAAAISWSALTARPPSMPADVIAHELVLRDGETLRGVTIAYPGRVVIDGNHVLVENCTFYTLPGAEGIEFRSGEDVLVSRNRVIRMPHVAAAIS